MLVVFHQYHQWIQPITHHHLQPSFTIIKPKLQLNPKKLTKCKKTKKNLRQGMETHNSIGRGSWTHVQNEAKYVRQTN